MATSTSKICRGEINMNRITGCILNSLAAVLLFSFVWATDAVSAEGGPDRITARLPGAYEGSRVLENADRIETTVMYPATSAAPLGGIQYLLATYSDRDQAISDFNSLLPDGHVSYGSWQVVLQSRSSIHWLRGSCEITEEQFRDVYGGAVKYVIDGGDPVEYAYLCLCSSACSRVAVDR